MRLIIWQRCKRSRACYTERRYQARESVTKCQACHVKRSYATFEPRKVTFFCRTHWRHGHSDLAQTFANTPSIVKREPLLLIWAKDLFQHQTSFEHPDLAPGKVLEPLCRCLWFRLRACHNWCWLCWRCRRNHQRRGRCCCVFRFQICLHANPCQAQQQRMRPEMCSVAPCSTKCCRSAKKHRKKMYVTVRKYGSY